MLLKDQIQQSVKDAMRAGQKNRVKVLRMVTAAIKQKEVDERIDPGDEQVLAVLDKMIKQRRDSISQYESAGRDDLSAIEKAEVEVLSEFMPTPLTDTEIYALVADAIAKAGASSMQDMGKVMSIIKPQAQGRADMSAVSQKIKALLSS